MTLRSYLAIMFLATLICWSAWAVVINSVNPETTNWVGLTLFYASLFLAIMGTAAIVGFVIRFMALRQELAFRHVAVAFRQAFLLALLIVGALILQSYRMLSWQNAVYLVVAVTVLEFFLISYRRTEGSV